MCGQCYIKPHAPRMGGSADGNAVSLKDVGSEKKVENFSKSDLTNEKMMLN